MFSKAAVQQVRNSDGIIVKQSSVPELFEADCCGKKPASGFLKTFRDKLHKAGKCGNPCVSFSHAVCLSVCV